MKDIKEIKRKIFVTAMIMALTFSVTLVTTPPIGAENGGKQVSPPDIKITNITFSDDTPVEGEEITVYATVLNNDSMPVSNITITFYVDLKAIGNATDITIKANESIIVNITWVAEKWDHNISAMLSIGNAPLLDTQTGKDISVEAEPIGDISSLVYALILIMTVVFGTAVVPSILEKVKNKGGGGGAMTMSKRKEERKEMKEEERSRRRKKIIFITVLVVAIVIIAFLGLRFIMTQRTESLPDLTDDWDIDDEISMPQDDPNFMGPVVEKEGVDTFIVQRVSTSSGFPVFGDKENVKIDQNTDIFWIMHEDNTLIQASIDDVQVGEKVFVWGLENSDGSWLATDIGIMVD